MKDVITKTFRRLKPSKPVLDRLFGKMVSRKFLAWIVATSFVVGGKEPGDFWLIITALYLGSETLLDAMMMKINGNGSFVSKHSTTTSQSLEIPIEEPEPDAGIIIEEVITDDLKKR